MYARRHTSWLDSKKNLNFTEGKEVSTRSDQAFEKPEAESVKVDKPIAGKKERIDIPFKEEMVYNNFKLSFPGPEGCHGLVETVEPGHKDTMVTRLHSQTCWRGEDLCAQWGKDGEFRPPLEVLVTNRSSNQFYHGEDILHMDIRACCHLHPNVADSKENMYWEFSWQEVQAIMH